MELANTRSAIWQSCSPSLVQPSTGRCCAALADCDGYKDPVGLLNVFITGILFSYALWRTGSLWWGIGMHMTWDWSQSFLYGVPDSGLLSIGRLFQTHPTGNPLLSGGPAGPEGSLLAWPVLLLLFLAIRLQPQGTQPPVEPEAGAARMQSPVAGLA